MHPSPDNAMTTKFAFGASDLPIDSVIVYRSSNALVMRSLRQDLKAGNNVIEITKLSSHIDTESFRVLKPGSGGRLVEVVCCVHPNVPERDDIQDDGESTQGERRGSVELEKGKEARESDERFSRPLSSGSHTTAFTERPVSDEKLDTSRTCDGVGDGVNGWRQSSAQHTHKNMPQMPKGDADAKATITIVMDEDKSVTLTILYFVGNTTWTPSYDLCVVSENGMPSPFVSLHFHARLSQITGEDWNNTSLAFSASKTTVVTDPLDYRILEQQSLSTQPNTSYSGSRSTAGSSSLSPNTAGVGKEIINRSAPMYKGISFVAERRSMPLRYRVEGKITIPSDGESHRVLVEQLSSVAVILLETVPSQHALAYFQGVVRSMMNHHLPPGPVSVFLDDECVSKTFILDLNSDTFHFNLGISLSTLVSYSRDLTSTSVTLSPEDGSEDFKCKKTIYTSTSTIKNCHPNYPITITEMSSEPVAYDERIHSILVRPTELAEARSGTLVEQQRQTKFKAQKVRRREGKFIQWTGTIDPDQQVTLVSEWEIYSLDNVVLVEKSSYKAFAQSI